MNKLKTLINYSWNTLFELLQNQFLNESNDHPQFCIDWCEEQLPPYPNWESCVGEYDPEFDQIKILLHGGITKGDIIRVIFHELIHRKISPNMGHGLIFRKNYADGAEKIFGFNKLDPIQTRVKAHKWEKPFIDYLDKKYK